MLQYAIFDLDGTLLDSMPMWRELPAAFCRRKGKQPLPGLADEISRRTLPEAVEYLKSTYGLADSPAAIQQELGRIALDAYRTTVVPKPGVPGALEGLHRAGIKMCVASASEEDQIQAALERLDLAKYFEFILSCTQAGAGKEHPDVYLQSLARLGGSDPAQAVVFEDVLHAASTAKAAGFRVAGVADDFSASSWPALQQLCDWWFTDASQWLRVLEQP